MASQPDHDPPQTDEGADPPVGRTSAKIIDIATRNVIRATGLRQSADRPARGAILVIVAVLGGITYWMANFQPDPQAGGVDDEDAEAASIALPDIPILTGIEGALPTIPLETPQELPAPPLAPVLAAPPDAMETPLAAANSHASRLIVFDAGGSADPGIMVGDGAGMGEAGDARDLGALASAASSKGRTLTKGTLIPAILETPIDTSRPGFVRAIVSADVRSSDGKRVLVPRSSRLVGQYVSDPSSGRTHAAIVWSRLTRPDGEALAIPGSGAGGGSRTAAGALTSIITGHDASALADSTIRVRQGEPIRILASQDIDL